MNIKNIYDDKGNVTSTSVGNVMDSYKYTYDDKGNVTSMTWYTEDGTVFYSWRYTYDDNGNKTSEIWYDGEGNVLGSDRTKYNNKGILNSRRQYDSEGNLVYSWEYPHYIGLYVTSHDTKKNCIKNFLRGVFETIKTLLKYCKNKSINILRMFKVI